MAEDVLISDIVKAMPKVSCATLETVMNLAALNSTYQGHEHIYKDDVTDALLQVVYKLSKTDKSLDLTECQKIALHEAAHAVVGEILNPDSIGIVTMHWWLREWLFYLLEKRRRASERYNEDFGRKSRCVFNLWSDGCKCKW